MDTGAVGGTPPSSEQLPLSFGRYKLLRRIGAGGMGEVFLARDESAAKPRACVVKKVLRQLVQNQNFINRFLDESKVVVKLNHPNIARVYAMGEVSGEYFLAMEYVQGKTISRFARRLRDRKQMLPVGAILLLGERICQGLAYAHEAVDDEGSPLQLVHRDLSPANVCVGYGGEVKIIDFGAAQSTLKEAQTAPRVVIGNLTYMSPEQAQKHLVDGRADIYSLGVTLWELFAWMWLPQKGDPLERWRRAANPSWEPPSRHRGDLPPEVDEILLRSLRKDPKERYADAREFGRELGRVRAKVAPEMDDEQLGRLLCSAFRREKTAEDEVLAELLGNVPISETPTDVFRAHIVVPPNALAFEHKALAPPAGFVPAPEKPALAQDSADAFSKPMPTVEIRPARAGRVRESRVGFGMPIAEPPKPEEENVLRRELHGDAEDDLVIDEAPPPSSLEETQRAKVLRTEVVVPVVSPPGLPWRLILLGLAVFAGALSVGFLSVWLLAT